MANLKKFLLNGLSCVRQFHQQISEVGADFNLLDRIHTKSE